MGKSIANDFSQITRIKGIFYWKQSNRSKSEWESHSYHSLFPFLSNNSHRSMFERICFFLVITCLHIVRISLRLFQMYITRTQITRSRYIDCLHRPFCAIALIWSFSIHIHINFQVHGNREKSRQRDSFMVSRKMYGTFAAVCHNTQYWNKAWMMSVHCTLEFNGKYKWTDKHRGICLTLLSGIVCCLLWWSWDHLRT